MSRSPVEDMMAHVITTRFGDCDPYLGTITWKAICEYAETQVSDWPDQDYYLVAFKDMGLRHRRLLELW